jgi:hypothetical protein
VLLLRTQISPHLYTLIRTVAEIRIMDVMHVVEIHNLCLLPNATWITNDEVQGQSNAHRKLIGNHQVRDHSNVDRRIISMWINGEKLCETD